MDHHFEQYAQHKGRSRIHQDTAIKEGEKGRDHTEPEVLHGHAVYRALFDLLKPGHDFPVFRGLFTDLAAEGIELIHLVQIGIPAQNPAGPGEIGTGIIGDGHHDTRGDHKHIGILIPISRAHPGNTLLHTVGFRSVAEYVKSQCSRSCQDFLHFQIISPAVILISRAVPFRLYRANGKNTRLPPNFREIFPLVSCCMDSCTPPILPVSPNEVRTVTTDEQSGDHRRQYLPAENPAGK